MVGTTNRDGQYSLGPFPRDLAYSVRAEKLGYIITEADAKGEEFSTGRCSPKLFE